MSAPPIPTLKELSIAAIVLAAGRGTRMGSVQKLMLRLPDRHTLLWHAVDGALKFKPLQTLVVVQPGALELRESVADLHVKYVPNPLYMEGMSTSLAAGVAALQPDARAALVLLGDQPLINPRIVRELIRAYMREGKAITIPRYGKQFGPPTIFSREAFPLLATLQGDVGGRQLALQRPEMTCIVPFDEYDVPSDVDTCDDFKLLL